MKTKLLPLFLAVFLAFPMIAQASEQAEQALVKFENELVQIERLAKQDTISRMEVLTHAFQVLDVTKGLEPGQPDSLDLTVEQSDKFNELTQRLAAALELVKNKEMVD